MESEIQQKLLKDYLSYSQYDINQNKVDTLLKEIANLEQVSYVALNYNKWSKDTDNLYKDIVKKTGHSLIHQQNKFNIEKDLLLKGKSHLMPDLDKFKSVIILETVFMLNKYQSSLRVYDIQIALLKMMFNNYYFFNVTHYSDSFEETTHYEFYPYIKDMIIAIYNLKDLNISEIMNASKTIIKSVSKEVVETKRQDIINIGNEAQDAICSILDEIAKAELNKKTVITKEKLLELYTDGMKQSDWVRSISLAFNMSERNARRYMIKFELYTSKENKSKNDMTKQEGEAVNAKLEELSKQIEALNARCEMLEKENKELKAASQTETIQAKPAIFTTDFSKLRNGMIGYNVCDECHDTDILEEPDKKISIFRNTMNLFGYKVAHKKYMEN